MSLVARISDSMPYFSDVWGDGNTAFQGHWHNQGGMDIYDISNPSSPKLASIFKGEADNDLRDVVVQNSIGFFSSNTNTGGGVYIVDVHDPYHPVELSRISSANGGPPHVHSMSVDGKYLYLDWNDPTIPVFDISDPSHPFLLRTLVVPSGGTVHEVTAKNGRLYAAEIDLVGRTAIFDISNVGDLSVPVPLLAEFESGSQTHTAWPTDDGNYVAVTHETYPSSGGTVDIYDIHDLANPTLAAEIPPLPVTTAWTTSQVMIEGNLMYVAWYQAGIRVYDITTPTHPVLVADYDTDPKPVNPKFSEDGAWGVYPFLGSDRILVGDISSGLFIVNMTPASVSGRVYQDTNGNAKQDTGEPGLAGRTVFLDQNKDGVLDNDTATVGALDTPKAIPDVTTITSSMQASGFVGAITDVKVTLNITHTYDSDLVIILITPWGAQVQLINREGGSGQNFTGTVLDDQATTPISAGIAPFTGSFQPEQPLSALNDYSADGIWILQVSDVAPNNSGTLDGWSLTFTTTEPSAQTDSNGNYTISGLQQATYIVRELVPPGWVQTTPSRAPISTISVVPVVNFGTFQLVTISGQVFQDNNGNGVQDSGDPGLAGRTVFLDQNQDGLLNSDTASASARDTPKAIPDVGAINSAILASGFVGTITDVNVTLNITHTFDSDLIITLISPWGASVQLIRRRGGSGQNFTNTVLDDQAATPISTGTAPFTGSFQPEQPLSVLNGYSANGTWALQVADVAPRDSGILQSWSITFTTTEPAAITDANGNYSFANLGPGTYTVREVVPSGWMQTTLNPPPVAINSSGVNVSGVNFGVFQLVTISGQVFQDSNGNGVQDSGEPGLAGQTVFLDLNNNGILDPGEPTTVTDSDGNFSFANLGPGTYSVREVVPSGWTQTTAAPASITTSSGVNVAGVNFGTFQLVTISGQVFQDNNGDGLKDGSDAGLAGWTVFVETNNNGILDPGEISTVTDASGNFSFTNLGPGTYHIRIVLMSGWQQTTSNLVITVSSGTNVSGVYIGVRKAH